MYKFSLMSAIEIGQDNRHVSFVVRYMLLHVNVYSCVILISCQAVNVMPFYQSKKYAKIRN